MSYKITPSVAPQRDMGVDGLRERLGDLILDCEPTTDSDTDEDATFIPMPAAAFLGVIQQAIFALSAPVVASPPALEGMVLVPREPTAAMLRKFMGNVDADDCAASYRAMLAASPAPAQQGAPQGGDGDLSASDLLAYWLDEQGCHNEVQNVREGIDLDSYEDELRMIGFVMGFASRIATTQPQVPEQLAFQSQGADALAQELQDSLQQQSTAWRAVVALLRELDPNFRDRARTGREMALASIRALATPSPVEAQQGGQTDFQRGVEFGRLDTLAVQALAATPAVSVGDAKDGARLDWLSDADNAADIGVYGIALTGGKSLRERIDAALASAARREG